MKNRKGQEEMVGFVLIVVLVVVIGVVFLGFYLRSGGDAEATKSAELSSLIGSIARYTTDCEKPVDEFKSMQQVAVMCYDGKSCENGLACNVLKDTLSEILENVYVVDEGSYIKYYKAEMFYGDDEQFLIAPIEDSNTGETLTCRGKKLFDSKVFSADGEQIEMRIEICTSRA